jgi:hypothetical protein
VFLALVLPALVFTVPVLIVLVFLQVVFSCEIFLASTALVLPPHQSMVHCPVNVVRYDMTFHVSLFGSAVVHAAIDRTPDWHEMRSEVLPAFG